MKFIAFGNHGEQVSAIGAGCMRISRTNEQEADAFVKGALEDGISFFDHADIYGGGGSERVFGRLLAKEPSLRDKLFLQSKCAIHDGLYDFSKEHILRSVDGILERLATDHIDSLLLHRPDALMEPEEVAEAFRSLKDSGKVRYFGVSNANRYQMELLESALDEPLVADQLELSIVHAPMIDAGFNVNMTNDPSIMHDAGTLEFCRLHDKVVQTWSPLQITLYDGTFLSNPAYEALNQQLNALAEEKGVTPDAIAYAWLLRYPAKMQIITGTTRPERLHIAAEATGISLSRAEWYALYKAAGKELP